MSRNDFIFLYGLCNENEQYRDNSFITKITSAYINPYSSFAWNMG